MRRKEPAKPTVKIAIIGDADAGKSTLAGLLSCPKGAKDDGKGSIRMQIFNFSHEK